MQFDFDDDTADTILVARLEDAENTLLKLIGEKIVPMGNIDFQDLFDYFQQLAMLRRSLEYFGGRWAHPFKSPNPTEFQEEITAAVKHAAYEHTELPPLPKPKKTKKKAAKKKAR